METLTEVVKDLVCNHGKTHTELLDHIRTVLKELGGELPKIEVLFNCCYGGFGFSNAFIEYVVKNGVKADEYDFDARTEYVPFIRPFGNLMLSRHRMFRRMILLCVYYGIDKMVQCAQDVYVYKKIDTEYNDRRKVLISCLNDPCYHGTKNMVGSQALYDILASKYPCLVGYTKESYEYFIEEVDRRIRKNQQDMDNIKPKYLNKHPSLKWDQLYENIENLVHQMRKEYDNTKSKYSCESSLADLLENGKEDDATIWYNFDSTYINGYAMRYMRIMHQDYDGIMQEETGHYDVYDYLVTNRIIEIPEDAYNNLTQVVGLVCASSKYCSLAITKVSQFVEWDIHEYDGLENIRIY